MKLQTIYSSRRQQNIDLTAKLSIDFALQSKQIAAEDSANDCYGANAKLLLEALDKNK